MDNKEITKYIFIEDEPQKADLIFIFGAMIDNAHEKIAEKTFELYSKGFANKILVSGGLNNLTNEIEANVILNVLLEKGIKKEDVILEDKSTNTLENVLFSKKVIEEKIGIENIKTVLCVVKNYHARRAMMTIKKYFPKEITFLAIPYKLFDFDKTNWQESEIGNDRVMKEYQKIQQYLKEEEIEEL